METKKYTELTVNERINYKSGWDIAIAYEGQKGRTDVLPNRPYCKLAVCLKTNKIPLKICQRDYNDNQHHRFLNGGRIFIKQGF